MRHRKSSACRLLTAAAMCCIGSLMLAGCNGSPAEQAQPVSASSTGAGTGTAAGTGGNPLSPAASPAAGSSSYLNDAAQRPAPVAMGDSRTFSTAGPLVVEQQADVTAERDGRVTSVKVEIGDHVHRGEVLATLDDRALQAEHAEKAAHLESLKAQVQSWEAEQKSNEADLRRADAMRAEKILDDEDWEHVQYKLTETKSQVARYQADETAAAADLHAADVELDQCRIVAPFDGVVGRRSVHDAQGVRKGDALFWITAQGPLHILFTVPESAMAAFPRGTRLELTTADYPHLTQSATVLRVSPVVDPASGSVEVIGNLEKPSALLKPGMSMQVKLKPR